MLSQLIALYITDDLSGQSPKNYYVHSICRGILFVELKVLLLQAQSWWKYVSVILLLVIFWFHLVGYVNFNFTILARKLAEDCKKYGVENQSIQSPLARASLQFGTSHKSMEDERASLLGVLAEQVIFQTSLFISCLKYLTCSWNVWNIKLWFNCLIGERNLGRGRDSFCCKFSAYMSEKMSKIWRENY